MKSILLSANYWTEAADNQLQSYREHALKQAVNHLENALVAAIKTLLQLKASGADAEKIDKFLAVGKFSPETLASLSE